MVDTNTEIRGFSTEGKKVLSKIETVDQYQLSLQECFMVKFNKLEAISQGFTFDISRHHSMAFDSGSCNVGYYSNIYRQHDQ